MIQTVERQHIQQLRSEGMSYSQICQKIGKQISKSTLSYICKDIRLSRKELVKRKEQNLEHLKQARVKAAVVNRLKLESRFSLIASKARIVVNESNPTSTRKIHLAMLYKAEGAKYPSYRGLAMGSFEADILKTYIKLLEIEYGKKRSDFRLRVQHRFDQDPAELEKYWADQLGVEIWAFYRSYADLRTKSKPTKKPGYMGVCVVSCSGVDIQLELDAIARLYAHKLWGVSSFG